MNISAIKNSTVTINDYTETALNIVEKLHDEYFFPIPANYDDGLYDAQLDKIINSYDYLAFAVALVRDALNHINADNREIANEVKDVDRWVIETETA